MSPLSNVWPVWGSAARLSSDGKYRYELTRRWAMGPTVTFIMLNPSTADATLDDPTIRRCMGFAKHWRMSALGVVNLFALRATDPQELRITPSPIGLANDDAIHDAVVRSRVVIAAWGVNGTYLDRNRDVIDMLNSLGRRPLCLKKTKDGHPYHPLYVSKSVEPCPLIQLV